MMIVNLQQNDNVDVTTKTVEQHGSRLDQTINSSSSSSSHWVSIVSLNYSLPTMIAVGTVLFAVIIATAIGNLLVGLALVRYRYLRTISNYLIGNLALSDFLLATTILPLSTANECLGRFTFNYPFISIEYPSVHVL